jgi:hypothetical protein
MPERALVGRRLSGLVGGRGGIGEGQAQSGLRRRGGVREAGQGRRRVFNRAQRQAGAQGFLRVENLAQLVCLCGQLWQRGRGLGEGLRLAREGGELLLDEADILPEGIAILGLPLGEGIDTAGEVRDIGGGGQRLRLLRLGGLGWA